MIFASTKSGFRLPTNKLQVIGQGIDIDAFGYIKRTYKRDQPFVLVVVGRISPVKDYETLIRATAKLVHEHGKNVCTFIVGGVGLEEQQKYLRELKQLAEELEVTKRVEFVGAKPNHEISEILEHAHCFVNTSRTGSLDKAMVEAMATGLPLVTSNESMQEVLGGLRDQLMFKVGDSDDLTGKLEHLIGMSDEERNQLGKLLRDIVVKHHQLKLFVQKILATMGEYGRNKD
jgi:glycosyltransferase involved in cell wall biosynthesis